jgi:O-antigen ligase
VAGSPAGGSHYPGGTAVGTAALSAHRNTDVLTSGVRRVLLLLAVATLPFTSALTLNLRFPLKIYEVALLGAGLTCLAQFRIPSLRSAKGAAIWMMALVAWALAVLLLHQWLPPAGLSTSGFTTRFGPFGDGVAKILYLLLSLFGFLLIAELTYRDEQSVIRWWLIGAITAALYSWYLVFASVVGLDPFLLPGIDVPQVFRFGNWAVIRSGTFEEGNFLGLYLLTSTVIALYARRRLTALFLGLSVLASFSTVNFAALALLSAVLVWRGSSQTSLSRKLLSIAAGTLFLVGLGSLLVATGYIETVLSAKLVGTSFISRLERLGFVVSGLDMFADHPITGVGISQYGYYYNKYEFLRSGFFSTLKLIANNVYVELLAELGIVGFLLFGAFLLRIYRRTSGPDMLPLRLGFLAVLLVWNAFPSFLIMFLWGFWGIILGVADRRAEALAPVTAPGLRLASIH